MRFDRGLRFCIGNIIGGIILMLFPLLLSGATLTPFVPDDPFFLYNEKDDTYKYFPGQWYLQNTAPSEITVYIKSLERNETMKNSLVDANLKGAWNLGYTGKGVVIGIIDDGVEGTQEDLKDNYSTKLSRSFLNGNISETQGPVLLKDNHGTSVAGVAAARGGNKIGGTGAAPYATIAGMRLLSGDQTDEDEFNAYIWGSGVTFDKNTGKFTMKTKPEIAIKNHSYGAKAPFVSEESIVLQSLAKTAANGVIHVFSAGNDRGKANEDTNKTIANSYRDVINVAALGSDGKYTDYSSYGASVFVTAPSNRSDYKGFGVTTTDRTGDDYGYNKYSDSNKQGDYDDTFPNTNYTATFGGTSSSAPLVSGILALGKEANPAMDVRIAKHVLVLTSTKVDSTDTGWVKNGGGNWFNPNYGFGNIDAGKFVETVKKVTYVTPQTSYATGTKTVNESIAKISTSGVGGTSKSFTLTTTELTASLRQPLEGVEVDLNFTHSKRGDLTASVTSPYTTKSCLFYSTSSLASDKQDTTSVTNFSWTFLTNAFWGEDPLGGTDKTSGTWTINMGDTVNNNVGTWKSYGVTLLMGKIVLSTGGATTQTDNIKAKSMTLQNSGDIFKNQTNTTLEVSEKIRVTSGELNVNGKVKMSTRDSDDEDPEDGLLYLDGGIVSGTGEIIAPYGFYHSSGTIKPGNSIGTITITGDYYQDTQGKLLIEIASPTSNDLLAINGAADLKGILETSWTGGYIPAIKTKFGTILTASSGVTGQFTSLLTNITPTVMFKPKYDIPNQIYLMVERDYINQNLLSYLTVNQRAMGSMLNSVGNTATGDLDTVLTVLDALPAYSQAAYALDQLAPKGSEAQYGMGIAAAGFQSSNISDRLSDLRYGMQGISVSGLSLRQGTKPILLAGAGSDLTGMIPSGMNDRWGLFIKGDAVAGDQKDTSDYLGYNFTTAGITMGSDYRFTKNFIAGVMLGMSNSQGNVDNNGSKVKIDSYAFGAYGTYYRKEFFIDGQISYGLSNYDNTRRIVFPGLDRTAFSRPRGNQFNAYGGMGHEFKVKQWMITPTMSLQYIKLGIDGYTERGAGAISLDVDKQNIESIQGNIGAKLSYAWQTDNALVIPGIRASYGYEFARDSQSVTGQLAQGSSPFSVATASPDRSSLSLGAGITVVTKNALSLSVNYGAQIGESKYVAQSVNAGVRIEF
ncbi:MAG: autotransporter domain-containing protein, partial [Proteobacteria bacterium]|nr:autotransporter domain-containing protein [Pseudomonadota bacterium]